MTNDVAKQIAALAKQSDKQFAALSSRMDHRFDAVEGRFDKVEERLGKVEGRIDKVEGRLGTVERELTVVRQEGRETRVLLEDVQQRVGTLGEGFVTLTERFDRMERNLTAEIHAIQTTYTPLTIHAALERRVDTLKRPASPVKD